MVPQHGRVPRHVVTPLAPEVVALLRCPVCAGALTPLEPGALDAVLGHAGGACREVYPVIGGVPRLLNGEARHVLARSQPGLREDARFAHWSGRSRARPADLRLVERFDREWERFSAMAADERARLFSNYFDLVPDETLRGASVVLDAGCGSGRWAAEFAARGPLVLALDLGESVEVTRRNTASDRVAVIQADVREVPIAPGSVDLAYSLGVLHHIQETEAALGRISAAVRPGGIVVIYVYYALDGRGPGFQAAFRTVDAVRRVISGLPASLLPPVTGAIAALVYWPLARTAALLERVGLGRIARRLPLGFYSTLSFRTMRNDSLDRFGTRLEKRFTRRQVIDLLEGAGLKDVVVSAGPPYWRASGRQP